MVTALASDMPKGSCFRVQIFLNFKIGKAAELEWNERTTGRKSFLFALLFVFFFRSGNKINKNSSNKGRSMKNPCLRYNSDQTEKKLAETMMIGNLGAILVWSH